MLPGYRPTARSKCFSTQARAGEDSWLVFFIPPTTPEPPLQQKYLKPRPIRCVPSLPTAPKRAAFSLAMFLPRLIRKPCALPTDQRGDSDEASERDIFYLEQPSLLQPIIDVPALSFMAPYCRPVVCLYFETERDLNSKLEVRLTKLAPSQKREATTIAEDVASCDLAIEELPKLEPSCSLPSCAESFEALLHRLLRFTEPQCLPELNGDCDLVPRDFPLPSLARPLPAPSRPPLLPLLLPLFEEPVKAAPAAIAPLEVPVWQRSSEIPPLDGLFATRKVRLCPWSVCPPRLVADFKRGIFAAGCLDLFASIKPLLSPSLALFSRRSGTPLDWLQASLDNVCVPVRSCPSCVVRPSGAVRDRLLSVTRSAPDRACVPNKLEDDDRILHFGSVAAAAKERQIELRCADEGELALELIWSAMHAEVSEDESSYFRWLEQLRQFRSPDDGSGARPSQQRYFQLVDDLPPIGGKNLCESPSKRGLRTKKKKTKKTTQRQQQQQQRRGQGQGGGSHQKESFDPLDWYLRLAADESSHANEQPRTRRSEAKRSTQFPEIGAQPFEVELAAKIMEVATTANCCIVTDAVVPTVAVAFLVMHRLFCEAKSAPSTATTTATWITADDEVDFHRLFVEEQLARLGASHLRVAVRSWCELARASPDDVSVLRSDLVIAQRHSCADHSCSALLSAHEAAARLVLFSSWPARTSSDLFSTMERLRIARLLCWSTVDDHDHAHALPPQIAGRHRVMQLALDAGESGDAELLVRAAMRRTGELSDELCERDLVPGGWLAGGPGQREFEVLAALLVRCGEGDSVRRVLELHCLIGAVQRLLYRGCCDALRFVSECRAVQECRAVAQLRAGLAALADEEMAGVRPCLLGRTLRFVQEKCDSHAFRNTLLVVESLAADAVRRNRRRRRHHRSSSSDLGHDHQHAGVQLLDSPTSFDELCRVASAENGVVVISWQHLPSIVELWEAEQLTLWPFDQVIDATMRWPVFPALVRELVKEPVGRRVSCIRLKPHTPPLWTDTWISQFLEGCPRSTIDEIAFLDYEIIFGQPVAPVSEATTRHVPKKSAAPIPAPAPAQKLPVHAYFDAGSQTIRSSFFR